MQIPLCVGSMLWVILILSKMNDVDDSQAGGGGGGGGATLLFKVTAYLSILIVPFALRQWLHNNTESARKGTSNGLACWREKMLL